METKLIVTFKVPLDDGKHVRSFTEEVELPFQRVWSDEPITFLIEKIRERLKREITS